VTARKTVVELVTAGTFRRDRHEIMLGFDFTLHDFLEAIDDGRVEVSAADKLRLEWCWWWQASLRDRSAHPDIALERFVAAMRGDHPPRLPPGMGGDA
jgi:hypothetical protein